jgi:hypothetical protein
MKRQPRIAQRLHLEFRRGHRARRLQGLSIAFMGSAAIKGSMPVSISMPVGIHVCIFVSSGVT